MTQSLLRAQLGHNVNLLILQKALTLELAQFEDPALYDRMTQARREASSRPLSLVQRSFGLVQNSIALLTYTALLIRLSPWAVGLLALGAIPAFIAEAKFAGQALRLFQWRTPEKRKQAYLEVVVAREDYAKEVKLFRVGPLLVRRYQEIYETLYSEDRDLTLRRGFWVFLLGLLSTAALYGAYVWIALRRTGDSNTLCLSPGHAALDREARHRLPTSRVRAPSTHTRARRRFHGAGCPSTRRTAPDRQRDAAAQAETAWMQWGIGHDSTTRPRTI